MSESELSNKNLNLWPRRAFEALPVRRWDEEIEGLSALVIVPTRRVHDSGYGKMFYVPVPQGGAPVCRTAECSDVLHIGGIGGWNLERKNWPMDLPRLVPPVGWSLDVLWKSRCLRLFCHGRMKIGYDLSSMEVWGLSESQERKMREKEGAKP